MFESVDPALWALYVANGELLHVFPLRATTNGQAYMVDTDDEGGGHIYFDDQVSRRWRKRCWNAQAKLWGGEYNYFTMECLPSLWPSP